MNTSEEIFTADMRRSMNQIGRLLKGFLARKQAGALIELAYANPIPYTRLVEAAHAGLTDYFLCRADFEGPALKEMGNKIAHENMMRTARKHGQFRRNSREIATDAIRSAFEIGPGTGDKIVHLLQSDLGEHLQSLGFIDKQVAFTNGATRKSKEVLPSLQVTQIGQDIYQEVGRHKFSSKVLGMILGGTISNVVIDGYPQEKTEFPMEQFVKMFDIIAAYYSAEEGGELLVSVDTSDISTMINGYRDRPGTSYNADFSMGALDFIEKIYEEAYKLAPVAEKDKYTINITSENPALNGRNDLKFRDIFRHEERYFAKSQLSSHCAVVDHKATVTIGKGDNLKGTELEAGWYNATVISAKPRPEQLAIAASMGENFRYLDSSSNRLTIGGEDSKQYRGIDIMRFDFNRASATTKQSHLTASSAANSELSPLQMVREALYGFGGSTSIPATFFPS